MNKTPFGTVSLAGKLHPVLQGVSLIHGPGPDSSCVIMQEVV